MTANDVHGEAGGQDPLALLESGARTLGEEEIALDVAALRERLEEARFFVACVGQFKRGKSTLLNALVGAPVLPIGVVPVTAVVTVLRHGPEPRLRVRTDRWRDAPLEQLADYVIQARNPDNAKGVQGVEIYWPSALLAGGMCLVDTPGLGSVFAHNTAATRSFVPHVDAALVVLGADPPISAEELDLVADIGGRVEHVALLINKADRLSEAEIHQAESFTREVIAKRSGRPVRELLKISAVERLAGSRSRDWERLERLLHDWAHSMSGELLAGARRRGQRRLSKLLLVAIDTHRAALLRPVEGSVRRLDALAAAAEDAERALRELEPLFRAEHEAIGRALEGRRQAFLQQVRNDGAATLLDRISTLPASSHPRTAAFELSQDVAREAIEGWARELRPDTEALYRHATERFVAIANDFLQRLRATESEPLADLPEAIEPEAGLRTPAHFYFTELLTIARPASASVILFAWLSRPQAIKAAHRRALPYLDRLLETNSSRLVNDFVERVRESGSRLRAELGRTLKAGLATARRAMDRANEARERGKGAVGRDLSRLAALHAEIDQRRLEAERDHERVLS